MPITVCDLGSIMTDPVCFIMYSIHVSEMVAKPA